MLSLAVFGETNLIEKPGHSPIHCKVACQSKACCMGDVAAEKANTVQACTKCLSTNMHQKLVKKPYVSACILGCERIL